MSDKGARVFWPERSLQHIFFLFFFARLTTTTTPPVSHAPYLELKYDDDDDDQRERERESLKGSSMRTH